MNKVFSLLFSDHRDAGDNEPDDCRLVTIAAPHPVDNIVIDDLCVN